MTVGDDEKWKRLFHENLDRCKEFRLSQKNDWDIYKHFYFFIKKFKNISQKAQHSYLSVKTGQWLPKTNAMKNSGGPLWIEEPFGEMDNLARSINNVGRIGAMFKETNKAFQTRNKYVILNKLVGEDMLKQIEGGKLEVEVGPMDVSSRDIISVSLSAALAKTEGTNVVNANWKSTLVEKLVSYASSDDEDKEGGRALFCYAPDGECKTEGTNVVNANWDSTLVEKLVSYASSDDEDKEGGRALFCYAPDGDSHEVSPNG